ncbi:hypothetical protein [Mitsuaria sp. 7]|uniref:hypothetical protein n=1 Tax=Mitsuaria sp. 7 TaxID=1658665 RepID=UPI0007DD906A|nr:hypothetical protein [Mitsuaria sp. 7]ANH68126.1 hypothetical protein ABE85_12055 [Mitsuaria sp. 7]
MSALPEQGELPAVLLLRHMEDMQHEWQRASQLGFRLEDEDLRGFRRQYQHLNVHDVPALGKVALAAYGLTESMARAMDERLPPNERLNVEWSPREAVYGVRLARGAILFVRGPGGTVQPQDTRILQFQRDPPR